MDSLGSEACTTIKDAVFGWDYLAKSQKDVDALNRLTTHPDAIRAWTALAKKESESEILWKVASQIGRIAVSGHLSFAQKKTRREIQEAATEASALAKRLITLIENNDSLRTAGFNLMPIREQVALNRILSGTIRLPDGAPWHERGSGNWFPPAVESALNEAQNRDYPEHKDITTSLAYRILRRMEIFDDFFIGQLKCFVAVASESREFPPITPRPNQASADHHVFAVAVCSTLEGAYGSPNCDLAASIASAVFNTPVDTETVKKWWQRRSIDFE